MWNTPIMKAVAALVAALALASCSAPASTPSAAPPAAATPSPTLEPPKVTLREACPQAEVIIKDLDVVPTDAEYGAAITSMDKLLATSDLETNNALGKIQEALEAGRAAKPGMASIDASQQLLAALDHAQTRCKAVGSSSFS